MTDLQKDIFDANIDEDTQKGKYLTFFIETGVYAIEIKFVTEIIGIQPITIVPEVPSYVKGIINLRGKIIPVMDVRLRFKKEPLEYNDRTCIIVVDVNDISLGLIVDMVSEVLEIPDEEIVLPPDMNKSNENKYIKAIGKVENGVNLILSCERLLGDENLEETAQ